MKNFKQQKEKTLDHCLYMASKLWELRICKP